MRDPERRGFEDALEIGRPDPTVVGVNRDPYDYGFRRGQAAVERIVALVRMELVRMELDDGMETEPSRFG